MGDGAAKLVIWYVSFGVEMGFIKLQKDFFSGMIPKKVYIIKHNLTELNVPFIIIIILLLNCLRATCSCACDGSYPDCRKPNHRNAGFREKYRIAEIN